MDQDLDMYHEATDTPSRVRTMNLNEDLGQVCHDDSTVGYKIVCVMNLRFCVFSLAAKFCLLYTDTRRLLGRVTSANVTVGGPISSRVTGAVPRESLRRYGSERCHPDLLQCMSCTLELFAREPHYKVLWCLCLGFFAVHVLLQTEGRAVDYTRTSSLVLCRV